MKPYIINENVLNIYISLSVIWIVSTENNEQLSCHLSNMVLNTQQIKSPDNIPKHINQDIFKK